MSEIIVGFDLEIRDIDSDILRERIPIKSAKDYVAGVEKYDNDPSVWFSFKLNYSSEGPTLKEFNELLAWSYRRARQPKEKGSHEAETAEKLSLREALLRALSNYEGLIREEASEFFSRLEKECAYFEQNEGAGMSYKNTFSGGCMRLSDIEFEHTISLKAESGERVIATFYYVDEGSFNKENEYVGPHYVYRFGDIEIVDTATANAIRSGAVEHEKD
ncbi:MAG: hypothetical protein M1353_02435 [Nitrospirae bacterium]|nr:hypothetical protein [Nitrospirota bacterium]